MDERSIAGHVMKGMDGSADWGTTLAGRPTAFWVLPYPVILTLKPNFGVKADRFGFTISWATNASLAREQKFLLQTGFMWRYNPGLTLNTPSVFGHGPTTR